MTRNQERAALIAQCVLTGRVPADDLPDEDWSLLMLAAGVNSLYAPAEVLSSRALEQAVHHSGYFAAKRTSRLASAYDCDVDDPTHEWFI